jgi:hypothetical protein
MYEGRIESVDLERDLLKTKEQQEVQTSNDLQIKRFFENLELIGLNLTPRAFIKGCFNCKSSDCVNHGKERSNCSKYIAE